MSNERNGSDVDYYLHERPHQALENAPLTGSLPEPTANTVALEAVVAKKRLGGVLVHYERRAGRSSTKTPPLFSDLARSIVPLN